MNRKIVSCVAAFALVVGASLVSVPSAQAGHCGLFGRSHCNQGCGGGLFSRLKGRHSCGAQESCCPAPAPTCCPAPAPVCCPAPAPTCCPEPAPAPCCDAAPVAIAAPSCDCVGSVIESAPVYESAPAYESAPCCGGESVGSYDSAPVYEGTPSYDQGAPVIHGDAQGYELGAGETIVPDSVQTLAPSEVGAAVEAPVADAAVESASDSAAPAAEAPAAEAPAAEAPAAPAPAADAPAAPADAAGDAAPPVPTPDANTDI